MNLEFTSERLFFRPLCEADADLGTSLLTDPSVMRYVGKTITKDEVVANLPKEMKRCAHGCIGIWCVIERAQQKKIGTSILLPLPVEEIDTNWDLVVGEDLPDSEIEVGYLLKPTEWGQGFATEICRRMLRFAFEDSPLDEVVAVTDVDNKASQRVLEKSGMEFEGLRRAYREQCSGYRLTRDQWQQQLPG